MEMEIQSCDGVECREAASFPCLGLVVWAKKRVLTVSLHMLVVQVEIALHLNGGEIVDWE